MEINVEAWTTIGAIVAGPIAAVLLTRWLDNYRTRNALRMDVFRTLMRTRASRIDPSHVGALNLVELEFYADKAVRDAFSAYIRHLNGAEPTSREALGRHWNERDDLFWSLMAELATAVQMKFDKADLERRAYQPVGLGRFNEDQMANALLLREVLQGQRPVPIMHAFSDGTLYPPPPPPSGE